MSSESALLRRPREGPVSLAPLTDAHVDTLMSWFPDVAAVAAWSPGTAFPFARERFIAETKLRDLDSYMLMDQFGRALAFGQYYARNQCCHLGRLVVAPEQRGKGYGKVLVEMLLARGTAALGLQRCSLFVVAGNARARALYDSLGFVETSCPEPLPKSDWLYLTRGYAAC